MPGYIVWWHLSDTSHEYMRRCEVMVKRICNVSLLKGNDYKLDGYHQIEKICDKCDNFTIEDVNHIVLQCDYNIDFRKAMFNEIENLQNGTGRIIIDESLISWLPF